MALHEIDTKLDQESRPILFDTLGDHVHSISANRDVIVEIVCAGWASFDSTDQRHVVFDNSGSQGGELVRPA